MGSISSDDAKEILDSLIDKVNLGEEPPIIYSKKGNSGVLISLEDFDSIQETIGLLSILSEDDEFQRLLSELSDKDHDEEIKDGPGEGKTDFIQVYQFKVALRGIRPPIWRRIQIPGNYSFWDLHVAIQDAMGWFDSHLHEFSVKDPSSGLQEQIGIPLEEDFHLSGKVYPGWKRRISEYFTIDNPKALYIYDFGDNWEHTITLEKIIPRDRGAEYPICIKGKRACPPEDCGGVHGYKELLETISNPESEEFEQLTEWLGGDFDPEAFDVRSVTFEDPRERWELTFS